MTLFCSDCAAKFVRLDYERMNPQPINCPAELGERALLQAKIEAKGFEIFDRMRGEAPGLFTARNVAGQLMNWSMRNEALKVQLFRLVDVLPSLRSSREIARHASEYLADGVSKLLPAPIRMAIRLAPAFPWLVGWAARQGVSQMAKTFILARNATEAVAQLRRMRKEPLAFTVDILGETVVSENEAAQRLYRSCGFVAYGHEVHALKQGGRYYDEVLMAVALDPRN